MQCFADKQSRHALQGGEPVITNLKPNGRRINVTDDNKAEYAMLKAQHLLYRAAEKQLDRVCDGFYNVIDRDIIHAAVRAPLGSLLLRRGSCTCTI